MENVLVEIKRYFSGLFNHLKNMTNIDNKYIMRTPISKKNVSFFQKLKKNNFL